MRFFPGLNRAALWIFIAGALWTEVTAGGFAGDTLRHRDLESEDEATLTRSSAFAIGHVVRTEELEARRRVFYEFSTRDGRRYRDSFLSTQTFDKPGTDLKVLYSPRFPNVHRPLSSQVLSDAPGFPWSSAVGLAPVILVALWMRRRPRLAWGAGHLAMSSVVGAFVIGCEVARMGVTAPPPPYTLQIGDRVSSGRILYAARGAGQHRVQLGPSTLVVDGKSFGLVPHGAHVWVRKDAVLVDGEPFAKID